MSPAIEIKNSRFICEINHCTKTHIAKTTNTYLKGWGGLADIWSVFVNLCQVIHKNFGLPLATPQATLSGTIFGSNLCKPWCARWDTYHQISVPKAFRKSGTWRMLTDLIFLAPELSLLGLVLNIRVNLTQ